MELVIVSGDRRTGKTRRACQIIADQLRSAPQRAAIVLHGAPVEAVAVLRELLPEAAYNASRRAFTLANGSEVEVRLGRGEVKIHPRERFDVALVDTPDKRAFVQAAYATEEDRSMVVLVANAPREGEDPWAVRLVEAAKAGKVAARIESIAHTAAPKVTTGMRELARVLDPAYLDPAREGGE